MLSKDGTDVRCLGENLLNLGTELLNTLEVWPLDFHSNRRFNSGERHVETVFGWHGPRVGKSWVLQLPVHLGNQFLVRHARRPLLTGIQHDGGVVHIERSVVGLAIRTSDDYKHGLYFWERSQHSSLRL